MGKDYFSKNNRVITNDEQFTAYVQKYNNKMEEEELRLLSSLGLTEEDIIDKTDPDLGTTRSAEAMLRSIDLERQYEQRGMEAARFNKETGKDIVIEQEMINEERYSYRILNYRC